MRTPSPPYCRLDLAPPLADRFIIGVAPIDYGPVLLLMPFGFHLAMDTLPSGVLPTALRPARHYPRFRIWRPSSGRQRDFNPPEQRAAQHTLRRDPTPLRRTRPGGGARPSRTGPPWGTPERSPGSRACSFSACLGSTTMRDHPPARDNVGACVAF